MIGVLIYILLLSKCCLGNVDTVVLDLSKDADHSKFIKTRHLYRGVEYYTVVPVPGYIVGKIVFYNYVIYDRKDGDDRVEGAYIYYNPHNHDIPVFVIKTSILRDNIFPINGRSQIEEEHNILSRTLMRFVKHLVPQNEKLQTQLADMDDTPEPVEMTISSIAYRAYNGSQYVGGNDGTRFVGLTQAMRSNRDPKEDLPMETEEAGASGSTDQQEGATAMDTS